MDWIFPSALKTHAEILSYNVITLREEVSGRWLGCEDGILTNEISILIKASPESSYEDIQGEIRREPRRGFSPDLTMSHPDLGLSVSRILGTKFLVYKSSSLCLWYFVIAVLQLWWNKHACKSDSACVHHFATTEVY